MTKTIRAAIQARGHVQLDFGWDQELIAFVKEVSGFGWDKGRKKWVGSQHALASLQYAAWAHSNGRPAESLNPQVQVQVAVSYPLSAPPLVMGGNLTLKDYQIWGAQQILTRSEFVLVWSPRVGKTATLLAAGATGISTRQFDRVIVVTPAQVIPEWEAALDKQFPGMSRRELVRGLGADDVASAHWVLVQHDQVAVVRKELAALGEKGKFMLAFDEPQRFTEWKAPRSQAMIALSHSAWCDRRIGLTGTPMRNDAEDLAFFFEVFGGLHGKKGSRPWGYLKRYCNAHQGEHGWECGPTDPSLIPELKHRLSAISHRLRLEEVRPDIPPMKRTVSLIEMQPEDAARYKALESALGKKALQGKKREQNTALKTLTRSTVEAKLHAAMHRIAFHCGQRKVKLLVAAHWHETLEDLAERLTTAGWPFYLAGGWMEPNRRKKIMAQWQADLEPRPLLLNIVASGIGIDLSDADGSLVLEVPWVPSDLLQFEPRIIDIHLGKRRSAPWTEYLLAKGSTDEDMALVNLNKLQFIDQVVGSERESAGLASSLRNSGVVNTVDLGLIDKGEDAVQAALDGLLARLTGAVSDPQSMLPLETDQLVKQVSEAFDDEDDKTDQEKADDDYDAAVAG